MHIMRTSSCTANKSVHAQDFCAKFGHAFVAKICALYILCIALENIFHAFTITMIKRAEQ